MASARDRLNAFVNHETDEDAAKFEQLLDAYRTEVLRADSAGRSSCSFPPCDAEAGEPCDRHEREQAHAEGEHCFCGPECTAA